MKVFGSLARISDLDRMPYAVEALPKSAWDTGDYVECRISGERSDLYHIEDTRGDMLPIAPGDTLVGALGEREATLEGVGSWRAVEDGRMDAMTCAGLLGRFTSLSRYLTGITVELEYRGHAVRHGRKIRMRDFALQEETLAFATPAILLVGTSMSAGKTTSGKLACKVLSENGLSVIGAKLTGAGRYRDILAFKKSGATAIYDFVDAGLPSTVVPEEEFRAAIRPLLSHIQRRAADVVVVEAGASPLEPYNGAAAIDELGDNICCTVLCASDPYSVVGVQNAFGLQPDLVAGPATNTSAGIALVRKLTGVMGINVVDPDSEDTFRDFLLERISANRINGAPIRRPAV